MRIQTQNAHRYKIFGMGKDELIGKVQKFAKEKLSLELTKEFLREFTPTRLYGAMRAAQGGEWHPIFTKWTVRKQKPSEVVQTTLPF
ncbi:MAG: hypothetical protein Q8Q95_04465 [bacterium]|nr:hypothetical protein [bacterium]